MSIEIALVVLPERRDALTNRLAWQTSIPLLRPNSDSFITCKRSLPIGHFSLSKAVIPCILRALNENAKWYGITHWGWSSIHHSFFRRPASGIFVGFELQITYSPRKIALFPSSLNWVWEVEDTAKGVGYPEALPSCIEMAEICCQICNKLGP